MTLRSFSGNSSAHETRLCDEARAEEGFAEHGTGVVTPRARHGGKLRTGVQHHTCAICARGTQKPNGFSWHALDMPAESQRSVYTLTRNGELSLQLLPGTPLAASGSWICAGCYACNSRMSRKVSERVASARHTRAALPPTVVANTPAARAPRRGELESLGVRVGDLDLGRDITGSKRRRGVEHAAPAPAPEPAPAPAPTSAPQLEAAEPASPASVGQSAGAAQPGPSEARQDARARARLLHRNAVAQHGRKAVARASQDGRVVDRTRHDLKPRHQLVEELRQRKIEERLQARTILSKDREITRLNSAITRHLAENTSLEKEQAELVKLVGEDGKNILELFRDCTAILAEYGYGDIFGVLMEHVRDGRLPPDHIFLEQLSTAAFCIGKHPRQQRFQRHGDRLYELLQRLHNIDLAALRGAAGAGRGKGADIEDIKALNCLWIMSVASMQRWRRIKAGKRAREVGIYRVGVEELASLVAGGRKEWATGSDATDATEHLTFGLPPACWPANREKPNGGEGWGGDEWLRGLVGTWEHKPSGRLYHQIDNRPRSLGAGETPTADNMKDDATGEPLVESE